MPWPQSREGGREVKKRTTEREFEIGPLGLVVLLTMTMTPAAKAPIRKYVTPGANFVLYLPQGWNCTEKTGDGYLSLIVEDPSGQFGAVMDYGVSRQAGNGQAKLIIGRLAQQFPTLRLGNSLRNNDYSRVVFDGFFTDPAKGKREFRCWVTNNAGNFLCSRIEAPEGKLAENREMLLSILANVRLIKGAFGSGGASPVALVPYRLGDGSATFQIPQGWRVQDLGKAQFIALDPAGRFSFMVATVEMVTPRLGVRSPGLLVLPYMAPHDALKALCAQLGIAQNMQFLWVNRHQDLERAAAGGGTAAIEDFLYTCDGKAGPSKGFTFGMCFYSRLGTNWSMSHFTVAGPVDQFDSFAQNFANMLQSYRINQAWVSDYIRRGLDNVRRLQRQTSEIVTRNAQEIHSMMQAAYEERQRSQDYIDYQRTNYIRGQQDWISSVEGGTVYHSDSWGLTNTATGEFYEGQPFDYVHFQGENPKYRETMTPVDNRELYEKFVQKK
jgi:uncharacterized protein (DUF736 family)